MIEYKSRFVKNALLLILGVTLTGISYFGAVSGETYIIFSGLTLVPIYNIIRLGYHYLSYEVPSFEFLQGKGIIIAIIIFLGIGFIGQTL